MDKKPLILIVDDEPFNVDYLEQELEDLEYDTVSAGNGQEALDQVAAHAPDMILLDIMMPVMDGFTTLGHLKADNQWRDIPVVVISAMSDMDSVARGIELGAEDYLPKPFDPVLLEARLTAGLEKKRLRDIEVEYLQQVEKLTDAATAVQSNNFDEERLQSVAERSDALGNLARVFQRMAHEVHAREQRLRQRIEQLQLDMAEQQDAGEETADLYLPMDRRHALAHGEELPQQTSGTALFADISGFTPLTAAFAQELGRQRGAEEMARLIKQVFTALIAEVHNYHGSVIGFSGDAITCWFDGSSTPRALACALAMQQAMGQFTTVLTPTGSSVSLTLKVAAAAGPARRLLAGDPAVQRIEILAGHTLDALSHAESLAGPGEVVATAAALDELATVAEWRDEDVALVTGLARAVDPAPWPDLPPLPNDQVRAWLLPPAFRMIHEGTSQFMAELRPANALFLQFSGIDYDGDPQAGQKLDQFVRWAQSVIDHYGGHLLQVTTGDKGSYLYGNFGALVAHEDDALRATLAALDLQSPPDMPFISQIQIGVASGQMYAGAYGSATRRAYGALSDKTNMAARLMVAATEGILCDEVVYQAAQVQVEFTALAPLKVKGKDQPLPVYRPTAVKAGTIHHSQIDRLPPALQVTIKIASVIGQTFSPAMLAAIHPAHESAADLDEQLQRLQETGLIVVQEGQVTFANSFIQQAAYSRMLFAQRRQLHRALATWYEQSAEEQTIDFYAQLAHHWQLAEEPAKTIQYLEKGGETARQQGDIDRAVQLYNQALKLEADSA